MNLCGKIILNFGLKHCLKIAMAVIFILGAGVPVFAQQIVPNDSLAANTVPGIDSFAAGDSLSVADSLANDTLAADTTVSKQSLEESLGIKISSDALPDVVTSEASDSAVLDMKHNIFNLYGNAKVNYEDMKLEAGKVVYDQENNTVTAGPNTDTSVALKDRPSFTQGSEKFTFDTMQYNFKSKRAIVRNARSQYGDGYVYSSQVKRNPDQSIYGYNNVYTTCALDHPHFGIAAKKIKVIPGKVVASGPANFMVESVPTPVFLPFGLFPISQGQRSGIILPTYTLEDARGLGLVGGGYYFGISDHIDLKVMPSIYSKGSWKTDVVTGYVSKYHYQGDLSLSYAYNKTGESYEPEAQVQKDFKIIWNHRSDAKSRPGVSFNASVNAGSASYNQNNTYNVDQILQNQFASSIAYTKAWQNKPYTLTIAARHSQNTQSRQVDVTLPEATFFVGSFNPFQRKNSIGTHWYDKITTSYTVTGKNQTSFIDSTLGSDVFSGDKFQNGITHSIPVNATYNLLRFINVNFNANYKEYWLTQQTHRFYDYTGDTVAKDINNGFYTARDMNAGMQLSTRIYGMKMFKKGKIAGIRHVLYPRTGFTYTPDFAKSPFRYGYQTIINPNEGRVYQPLYEGSIVGVPGYGQFGSIGSVINFGLDNNLQVKVRTDADSTGFKNVRLIDNFEFTTDYNMALDSFNWTPLQVRFATNIANIFNIRANATYDLYPIDTDGKRIKTLMIDKGMGLGRFTSASAGFDANFKSRPKGSNEDNPATKTGEYQRLMQYGGYNDYLDFNIPWSFRFSYSMQVNKNYLPESQKDTLVLTHSALFGGDFNLTERWKVTYNSGYNITEKKLQITYVSIVRDLHCWIMSLGAVPFGPNKYYTFTLNVKAQVLQDLKLVRRRDYRDATY